MRLALLFAAIGVVTLVLRSSFILRGESGREGRFDALRRFVPVAALTALVVPSLFPRDGEPALGRVVAIAVAAVAARRGNVLLTVVVGLGVLVGIKTLG